MLFKVLVLVVLFYSTNTYGARECETCADIVLLIDESGSIDEDEFDQLQLFLISLVESFSTIGPPSGVQFAAVCFSSPANQEHHFFLNDFDNKVDIVSAIAGIAESGGSTYIGAALEFTRTEAFNESRGAGRACAKQFVIVLTDGVSSDDPVPAAQLLKDDNVTIIAVAIGNGVNLTQIEIIASDPALVFSADFNDLEGIKEAAVSAVCPDQITDDGSLQGLCAFPCTLQNKTYELCPCDPKNANQTYSVNGGLDPTVLKQVYNETEQDWECYTRSGRFYVVRRCLVPNVWEYRCLRDTMFDSEKDIRVWCVSDWVHFGANPSLCDVCDGADFDEDKALIVKEQSVDCGIVILQSSFCGCTIPTLCPAPENSPLHCDACESSEGNDDGLCCE